jgi:hypothetical protein
MDKKVPQWLFPFSVIPRAINTNAEFATSPIQPPISEIHDTSYFIF